MPSRFQLNGRPVTNPVVKAALLMAVLALILAVLAAVAVVAVPVAIVTAAVGSLAGGRYFLTRGRRRQPLRGANHDAIPIEAREIDVTPALPAAQSDTHRS